MIDIKRKEECCGCYGCTNVCPKQCISMEIDNEGFWYPKVDKSKCIDCNLCEKVCPVISSLKDSDSKAIGYACKNKDEIVRKSSSSGGVFFLLCQEVMKNDGVVFGASFDNDFNVRHTYAESLEECIQFKSSKYVQSKIGDNYKKAKEFLDKGRLVLFSGTQCQIKGLNLYLRKKYDNLITVDVVCHGVPSPKVFKAYRNKLIKQYGGNIKDIRFRDKVKGWNEFSYVTEFDNGKVHCKTLKEDMYMKGFLKNLYLRPSCYYCKAKNYSNGSDISLADYWKVQAIHLEIYDDKGVSLVIVNNEKGKETLEKISDNIELLETDLQYAVKHNPCIVRSVNYNPKREEFFNVFNGENIDKVIKKYTKVTLTIKIKVFILNILGKVKRYMIKCYKR